MTERRIQIASAHDAQLVLEAIIFTIEAWSRLRRGQQMTDDEAVEAERRCQSQPWRDVADLKATASEMMEWVPTVWPSSDAVAGAVQEAMRERLDDIAKLGPDGGRVT
jgi:hypothetical protein